ncbi:MAG: hypothetical protein IT462_06560 [Planctomycetes bacterium]|nr:hypothetical protein [Planctomycetota bacterium]
MLPSALLVVLLMLAIVPVSTVAQATSPSPQPSLGEGDKPKTEPVDPSHTGGDRPVPYPRVAFGNEEKKEIEKPARVRAYLIDCSADMSKKFSIKEKDKDVETTRLAYVQGQVKLSLDLLRNNPQILFNVMSYGDGADLGGKVVPFSATVDGINQAKAWLDDRKAQGTADFFAALKGLFDDDVAEVRLLAGTLPVRPAGVDEKELAKDAKAAAIQDFIVAAVTAWRKAGKKTTLDIVGIDLVDDAKAFYKRLAKAGGGQYLD